MSSRPLRAWPIGLLITACSSPAAPPPKETKAAAEKPAAPPPAYDQIDRAAFNRAAAEQFVPLFWVDDKNGNKKVDPDEVTVLYGLKASAKDEWVKNGAFTAAFNTAYVGLAKTATAANLAPEELRRRAAVKKELSQGRPTVVLSDFTKASAEDRGIVEHVLAAMKLVEDLHMKQKGTLGLDKDIPADDPASRTLFYRNQGPDCEAPATEQDPDCSALPSKAKPKLTVYPADVQDKKDFCQSLEKENKEAYLDHFSAVVREGEALKGVPYHVFYKAEMEGVAAELDKAAAAITSADELPFKAYLTAAAKAFRDGSWGEADEAWAKMSVKNSKWYLRIGPDEVYWEPCQQKAGFHASFAATNKGSLEWQGKLEKVQEDMEKEIAKLAGAPYKARKVTFSLPDFLDVILNAGDSRSASGATIGQSLPNWGKVVDEGRGRTVAMVNFYSDPDSVAILKDKARSLLCKDTMALYTSDPGPQIMSTVLHEATHNLGPSHDYKAGGKTDDEAFGGKLAATMEELKAQSGALYFTDWLATKGIITADDAAKAHVRDVVWGFGHISRGMYAPTGEPKNYSQLASIQFGVLMNEKALTWKADEMADNGTDKGCFSMDMAKWPVATKKLLSLVGGIKARADKKGAEKLKKEFVDDPKMKTIHDPIAERVLRFAKESFVYSVAE
ncbi:MAG: hypothetical protein U1E65_31725 [Myxococcota bacterium]